MWVSIDQWFDRFEQQRWEELDRGELAGMLSDETAQRVAERQASGERLSTTRRRRVYTRRESAAK